MYVQYMYCPYHTAPIHNSDPLSLTCTTMFLPSRAALIAVTLAIGIASAQAKCLPEHEFDPATGKPCEIPEIRETRATSGPRIQSLDGHVVVRVRGLF